MQGRPRAKGGVLWPLLVSLPMVVFLVTSASADCGAELAALKAKLPAVTNPRHREEAKLLLEKAAIEQQHSRAELCEAAVAQASKLLH